MATATHCIDKKFGFNIIVFKSWAWKEDCTVLEAKGQGYI